MIKTNLFELRTRFNESKIMLCFNGPISRSLIEEIGSALRNYLQAEQIKMTAAMDVFGIYIEMSQNIRHYAHANNLNDADASATIIVAKHENRYLIQAGNIVKKADGESLMTRVNELANMSAAELKAAYKKQLREPHEDKSTGAGLGLIDIARKSTLPIYAEISPIGQENVFFSLCATV